MTALVAAIEGNQLDQLLTLRRHWLPTEDDSELSMARAMWLHKNHFESLEAITANGVNRAFSGKG
ncbi:DUF6890 family protein [Shewanella frigidimarina]|uniref:DUF6890 family protein n=1 Tax=Shewanella frigidimarina TaxID=56812 RepID=UPI003D796D59